MQCGWVQFSGGLTVSMTLVARQRCELSACHEWRTSLRPIPSLQPNQPIITHNSVLAAEHVYKVWDAQCHSSMPCGHTPDTKGAHLCTNVVMNRRCARGAASRVWVTIRVQAGRQVDVCMEWCSAAMHRHPESAGRGTRPFCMAAEPEGREGNRSDTSA